MFPSLYAWVLALLALPALAHDPSAWGGVFRSRDFGATWLPADAGRFIGGALALAIHPKDANHLLFGTDTGLLRSRNGGRDWKPEAPEHFFGPITAVSFDAEDSAAVASSAAGLFQSADGVSWTKSEAPAGAAPARKVIAGFGPREYFVAGPEGLFFSRDGGQRFTRLGEGVLPTASATHVIAYGAAHRNIFLLQAGRLWRSQDGGAHWQQSDVGLPAGKIEVVWAAPAPNAPLWVVASDQVFSSVDEGAHWIAKGRPLPDAGTSVRAIAVSESGSQLLLATHRGVLASTDSGASWAQIEGSLPVHLEAGLLLRDPHDAQTLYAGFAITPYPEIYRRAQEGSSLLARTDPISLAGGAAFLLLLMIAGGWLASRLSKGRT